MPWAEISLVIPRELAELAEVTLEQQGALAVTLQDHSDVPVLEPAPGATPVWPLVRMHGLFPADVERRLVAAALSLLPRVDGVEPPSWKELPDRQWERAWMDGFQPMKFGRNLWIVPSGMADPDDAGVTIVRLDPGLAFGTGTHPTTALCLEWIDGHDLAGQTVVDFGCGSGVLGIAAALKGAQRVICVDNDPQALEATADNAGRNGVAERVCCLAPDEYGESRADVVVANILAGPLVELAPCLQGSLKPGGRIVLAGVLAEQADWVAGAYKARCGELSRLEKGDWVRLDGTVR